MLVRCYAEKFYAKFQDASFHETQAGPEQFCTDFLYQNLYRFPVPKFVEIFCTKICTDFLYQILFTFLVPNFVQISCTKICTDFLYQILYRFPVPNFVQISCTKFHKINIANGLVSDTSSQMDRQTDRQT
jgi:hypothetical protein